MDVTPFGARFTLERPVKVGRLIHLTLPMPRELRCFDHLDRLYQVWALVRNIEEIPQEAQATGFAVGVAFVGKEPPISYVKDPLTLYESDDSELQSSDSDEAARRRMPQVHERARGAANVSQNEQVHDRVARLKDQRRGTRFNIPIDVIVETLDGKGHTLNSEQAVVENISRRGAAIYTTLRAERGSMVRLISSQYSLTIDAVVRAYRTGTDNIPRLHLEFVGRQWPLEGVE